MTLEEWRLISGLTYADIAELIPCSKTYPGMIARGKVTPGFKMACRIEEVTQGLVPRTNWFPDRPAPIGAGRNINENK